LDSLANIFANISLPSAGALLLVGFAVTGLWIYLAINPWKCLIVWTATIAVQANFYYLHIALADLFVVPLVVGALLFSKSKPWSPILKVAFAFTFLFLTVGNAVTLLRLGKLPVWTYVSKDIGLIEMVVCFWATIVICRTLRQTLSLVNVFLLTGSALNVAGLLCFISFKLTGIGSFVMFSGVRYVAFMIDPNGYCGYLGCLTIFQLWFLLNSSKVITLPCFFQWINFGLLITGCLLTMSRSGWLGLLGGIACMFLFVNLGRVARLTAILLLAVILGGFLMVKMGALQDFEERSASNSSIEGRMELNKKGWEMYTEGPSSLLAGIGIGTFEESSEANFGLFAQIHNTFLWLLVEGGPLLLGVFGLMLFKAQSQNYAAAKRQPAPLNHIAIASFCALGGFVAWCMGIEGMYHRHFWILLSFSDLCFIHFRTLKLGVVARRKTIPQVA
jgi:O-antigen ligase